LVKQYNESLKRFQLPEFDPKWGMIRRGIEKESLRVSSEGLISQVGHPAALGSALTNPFITTDFSEALLEFITPAYASIDECLSTLDQVHRYTVSNLEQEMLWVSSMPCPAGQANEIPLARYGSSNIGQLKTLYRSGLSERYGSIMQAIAGIHYNFSMPEEFWPAYQKICNDDQELSSFITDKYLHLIRNFHRYSWLLIYLFGASPAACRCFVEGREHALDSLDEKTLYLPDATCLRMGNLGYKSETQDSLFVCYNELDSYVNCLDEAMRSPVPEYQAIDQRSQDGKPIQINANLLQLENEFYSTIRPKRNALDGERPLSALTRAGIEYVEVRCLDLNPFHPLGIDAEQIRFLDSFLLYCLLSESTECHKQEFFEVAANINTTVNSGRNLKTELQNDGSAIELGKWATSLLDDIQHSATILDTLHESEEYNAALSAQQDKLANPDLTPSGAMLKIMEEQNLSFYDFSLRMSAQHRDHFLSEPLDEKIKKMLDEKAAESIVKQKEIEAADELNFEDFLTQWNSYSVHN